MYTAILSKIKKIVLLDIFFTNFVQDLSIFIFFSLPFSSSAINFHHQRISLLACISSLVLQEARNKKKKGSHQKPQEKRKKISRPAPCSSFLCEASFLSSIKNSKVLHGWIFPNDELKGYVSAYWYLSSVYVSRVINKAICICAFKSCSKQK